MRILSVIGALALAACLALPVQAASAPVALDIDQVVHQLDASAPAFDIVADIQSIDLMPGLSTDAAHKADGNCSDSAAWIAVDIFDGIRADRLAACNPRRHDPGWRSS